MTEHKAVITKAEFKQAVRNDLRGIQYAIDRYEPRVDSSFKFRESVIWDEEKQAYARVPANPNHERMYHRVYVTSAIGATFVASRIVGIINYYDAVRLDRIYITSQLNPHDYLYGADPTMWLVSVMTIERRKE